MNFVVFLILLYLCFKEYRNTTLTQQLLCFYANNTIFYCIIVLFYFIFIFCLDDITVAICPGIGNSSESVYIRTFVHYAQCHGYRCAVLNHIGALSSVQVTASRIFTYGKSTTTITTSFQKCKE